MRHAAVNMDMLLSPRDLSSILLDKCLEVDLLEPMVSTTPHFCVCVCVLRCFIFWASPVAQWERIRCNAGDAGDEGLIPGSASSPGGGHGNPF